MRAGDTARAGRRPDPDLLFAVAVGLLLSAVALEGGGGLALGPTTTVEIVLQIAGGIAGVLAMLLTGAQRLHGGLALALFAALTALTIASIGWAVQPSDAWLESARTLSYLATFGAGMALVRLGHERWAGLLGAVMVAAVIVSSYALLTKVFPGHFAADEIYARLREPFGYWNAVGLMGALGVPACLWLGTRRSGHPVLTATATPLLGLLFVVILLSYSRGSILAALAGAAIFFAIVPLRLRAVAVLAPAAVAAGVVGAWAFKTDALSKDRMPLDARIHAGHQLGLAVVAMLLVLMAAAIAIGVARSRRAPSPQARRIAGTVCLILVALVPFALAARLAASDRGLGGSISHTWTQLTDPNAGTPSNDPSRLSAVGSVRATYFDQALKIYREHKLKGAGAGGFATARSRFRKDGYQVRHAHGYVFQTIADLGLLGLALSLLLTAAWLAAAVRAIGLTRRGGLTDPFDPERVGLVTLVATVVVFGVHSAVDWTWFVPGTAALALLCAGWVAGRGDHRDHPADDAIPSSDDEAETLVGAAPPTFRERLSAGARNRPALVAAAIVGLLAVSFAWSTYQPLRARNTGNEALDLLAANKIDAARQKALEAHDQDPLSIDPLLDLSSVEIAAGHPHAARVALKQAQKIQPENAETWLYLAGFDLDNGDRRRALIELGPALYLDPRSTQAVTLLLQARREAP